MPLKHAPYTLQGTFVSAEEKYVRLHIEGIGEIRWPRTAFPIDLHPGETITISLQTKKMQHEAHINALRTVLTELVN